MVAVCLSLHIHVMKLAEISLEQNIEYVIFSWYMEAVCLSDCLSVFYVSFAFTISENYLSSCDETCLQIIECIWCLYHNYILTHINSHVSVGQLQREHSLLIIIIPREQYLNSLYYASYAPLHHMNTGMGIAVQNPSLHASAFMLESCPPQAWLLRPSSFTKVRNISDRHWLSDRYLSSTDCIVKVICSLCPMSGVQSCSTILAFSQLDQFILNRPGQTVVMNFINTDLPLMFLHHWIEFCQKLAALNS